MTNVQALKISEASKEFAKERVSETDGKIHKITTNMPMSLQSLNPQAIQDIQI